MGNIADGIWIFLIGFFLFCILFLPIFVWQIKNATQKTNRLLQELIDQGKTKKEKSRYNQTGLLGDQGTER